MITHEQILVNLIQAFPPTNPGENARVYTVSRHKDETLGLPEDVAHVFIPDLHLLTSADASTYPKHHFVQDEDFKTFLKKLCELKTRWLEKFEVYQLGDLFDIWRARSGTDKEKVDAIRMKLREICLPLTSDPPYGVDPKIIAGNHDYALHQLSDWLTPRARLIEDSRGEPRVLLIHGDIFSVVEQLPDPIQEWAVQMASGISAGGHVLDPINLNRELDTEQGRIKSPGVELTGAGFSTSLFSSAPYNVVDGDASPAGAGYMRFFEPAKQLALALKTHNLDIRAMVIGHTHYARMIKGNRGDGVTFTLMDCGAWFGKCRLRIEGQDQWLWSAQIGVLIQDEFCIYQLGQRPTTSPQDIIRWV
jgi:UDP-2,3-diacylglucosamine pyrophosphatase LpxH